LYNAVRPHSRIGWLTPAAYVEQFFKPNHPWTNGQVERMNRTLKEATVNRYHYDMHDQLRTHLADFVTAYNFGRMTCPVLSDQF
jgi:transposase InsO family protein